jgi:hypothetical protein
MDNTKGISCALEIFEERDKVILKSPTAFQRYKLAALLKMAHNTKDCNKVFYLPDLVEMEDKALETQELADAVAVWSIPFYSQRKYWFKLFIGFNYGLFASLLTHWTLQGIPEPTFSDESIEIYRYLAANSGIEPMHKVFGDVTFPARKLKSKLSIEALSRRKRKSNLADAGSELSTSSSTASLKSKLSKDGLKSGFRRIFRTSDSVKAVKSELTEPPRQSKLSQEQLSELQRSTHFDKKELQQWYKGGLLITFGSNFH